MRGGWVVLPRLLALVCTVPQERYDKPGLLDYNFEIFKKAITEVRVPFCACVAIRRHDTHARVRR
jgi:hypothetical protein